MNGIGKIGHRLFLPGGGFETGNGFERWAGLMVYDTRQDRWIRKADMPQASSEGVAGVIDGKLYVLTGMDNVYVDDDTPCPDCSSSPRQWTRRLFRYNPDTDRWVGRASCPNFHVGGAAGVIGGKLYAAGGLDREGGTVVASRELDIYNPATNTRSAGAPMPQPRARITGAVLGGQLYVIGGFGSDGAVTAYDPATNRWITKTPLPEPLSNLAADRVFLKGRPRILVIGGAGTDNRMYAP